MKYLGQLIWIILFSFIGELLHSLIKVPVPASIYGLAALFLALMLKLVKLEWIKDAGNFLVSILPLLFICPAVGLIDSWSVIRENRFAFLFITLASLLITFAVSGIVTKLLISKKERFHD